MFESLSDKLQETFRRLSGKGRLSEADVNEGLREVRLALLEADVNYRVVKDLIKRISERAVGAEVITSLTPAQAVIKIVNEELIAVLGEAARLELTGQPPHVIMLVGLQGSGKTTMAAKLAVHLRGRGQVPLLVAADVYRPAAIAQLETLAKQINVPVHTEPNHVAPPAICENAVKRARREGQTVVILDTAGRLQIDDQMMAELEEIRRVTTPNEILLIADAMTGQEAVSVAQEFHQRVQVTGLILTKVDGDARGGAALSIRAVTGVPIKFMGVGEKLSDLEVLYPDRLASRILGMGDVLTLIERAEASFSEEEARKVGHKMRTASFTLEDFIEQLQAVKRMGPLSDLLGMIPGMSQVTKALPAEATEAGLKVTEAIIHSMTPEERRNPRVINASRKRRIARGSGTSVQEVNQLLRQFSMMQDMMKQMQSGKGRGLMGMFR
ncbi:MAG TPA: signal recognition particle protein [Chloroflexi bacterium]|jgi:signal recognition particle subunit SRP54|nr:signal recognition particle protein [Chloroflexota bacterium]